MRASDTRLLPRDAAATERSAALAAGFCSANSVSLEGRSTSFSVRTIFLPVHRHDLEPRNLVALEAHEVHLFGRSCRRSILRSPGPWSSLSRILRGGRPLAKITISLSMPTRILWSLMASWSLGGSVFSIGLGRRQCLEVEDRRQHLRVPGRRVSSGTYLSNSSVTVEPWASRLCGLGPPGIGVAPPLLTT